MHRHTFFALLIANGIPSNGPVAIFWDMENCPIPSNVLPEDAAGNIRMALRHSAINGAVNVLSAYADFNGFSRSLREGCQRTGVKLIDVPNGRKDAVDKAILVDMFLFALDNPPPSSIMLISGDVDFSNSLHVLGQRGYTIIVVFPFGANVSSPLSNAGSYVLDWYSVVRGQGFSPSIRSHEFVKAKNDKIVVREMISTRIQSSLKAQPLDLNGLKSQLVKILKTSGGLLSLARLASMYKKTFGKPLNASEYGTSKLMKLLKKMSDVISVEDQGTEKVVVLLKKHSKKTTKCGLILKKDKSLVKNNKFLFSTS
uniref:uncharacterized protein LOC122597470 n=1 Tax=Erigeron canadensis TaxID=72917 RepID=UPI001CB91B22|nr:uncharacterized protein LOC122597470 [Erigeron canadensis]